jgi:hypothetical protein
MYRIKSYNEFLNENYSKVDEINLNLFGKFKKLLSRTKDDGDKEFLDDIEIMNPKTKKSIKLSSALSYDKNDPMKKLADLAMAELKDNVKDSKYVTTDQKIEFQFKKELKKRQEQSKEWGEEWTENDTHSVKSEILTNNYVELEDEKKTEFLKKNVVPSLEGLSDSAKHRRISSIDSKVNNEGADVMYDTLGDVDAYLNHESGKGQEVTNTILRSTKATPKQRQKAIMYDWVANPSSSSSIMMANHMADKLKMGKDARSGVEYRKKNGVEFDKTFGGDLEKEQKDQAIKAVDDIYNKTQEYYKSKGIKTVKVYRGSNSKDPASYSNAIESWTTSKESAAQYGQYVLEKEIPVERVLMGHFNKDFPDPYDFNGNTSKEIVILGE